jgi:hypothetical protein
MKMIVRRFHLLLILIAGLFVFQGTMAEVLPREKTRTEVTVGMQAEQNVAQPTIVRDQIFYFFVRETLQKPQVQSPLLLSLIISYQQHHASL